MACWLGTWGRDRGPVEGEAEGEVEDMRSSEDSSSTLRLRPDMVFGGRAGRVVDELLGNVWLMGEFGMGRSLHEAGGESRGSWRR